MMKMPVGLFLLLALSNVVFLLGKEDDWECNNKPTLHSRPHSVSIAEFGAIGDGKTLNTLAFQNAIFYLKSFADKGGAQLYVPAGKWLTGSFNLTSHLTLFLEKDAVILGSPDPAHWEVASPLPSYGRGIDLPGPRHRSLISGYMLNDVIITGHNGTVDGQGLTWWDKYNSHSLDYSRPHLVEFIFCNYTAISNITFLNAPAYNIHPVYCSYVLVLNVSVFAPPDSPYTLGVVPDSSDGVCIEDSRIVVGHDAISVKSGWDEYGIAYGRPSSNIHIRSVSLKSFSGASLAFGSEMSGGISDVRAEQLHISDSYSGIGFRTAKGRGGYIKNIIADDAEMENVYIAIDATGQSESHPDDKYDKDALPFLNGITFQNVVGTNISIAGSFSGIQESPFTSVCLLNVSLSIPSSSSAYWVCSNVSGLSQSVVPEPCPDLEGITTSNSSSGSCFPLLYSNGRSWTL
uniref:Polygalacturonase n=1 Tax=Kalanchoe fedtschenkoi TaxID=63787 RepID=A0A7N0UJQ4_KALFE